MVKSLVHRRLVSFDAKGELRADFASHVALQTGGYDDLAGEAFDVLINATSAGLSGEALPLRRGHRQATYPQPTPGHSLAACHPSASEAPTSARRCF